MKPQSKNRSRAHYRHHRKRVIQRKTKIAKPLGWHSRYTDISPKGKCIVPAGCVLKKRIGMVFLIRKSFNWNA